MIDHIEQFKGAHPGKIVSRELERRHLKQGPFALRIGEYPQLLNAVLKGRRRMNPKLSLKIEYELGLEKGLLTILQAFYDLKLAEEELRKENVKPDFSRFKKSLFWDTNVETIDWLRQKTSVMNRVEEYGSAAEKAYFNEFYSKNEQ